METKASKEKAGSSTFHKSLWSRAYWLWTFTLVFLIGSSVLGQSPANPVNTVKSLRAVGKDATDVEMELHSTREFPVRDALVLLRIGAQEIRFSRSPESGSLNTLIFHLSPVQWAQARSGDAMTVYYSEDDPKDPESRWVYPALDKTQLNK